MSFFQHSFSSTNLHYSSQKVNPQFVAMWIAPISEGKMKRKWTWTGRLFPFFFWVLLCL